MKKLFLAFFFLFAQQAFAQCEVYGVLVQPDRPYNDESSEVLIGGFCGDSNVPHFGFLDIDGSEININLEFSGDAGLTIPTRWGERVKLPLLPAGTYTIRVRADGQGQLYTQTLTVRSRPFKIAPQFGPAGTEVVITGLPLIENCGIAGCREWGVLWGTGRATDARMTERGLVATVPNGANSSNVTVELPDHTSITFTNGWHYNNDVEFDFDRVLFPINFTGKGAHGSDWHTDVVIRNDAPITIATEPLFWLDPSSPVLPPMQAIPPGAKGNLPEEPRDGGKILYVPRDLESSFAYASHAVDRSRSATDLGTEVPVVRAEDTANEIRLLDVPVDARYRAKLRIYDFDGTNAARALLTLRNPASNAPLVTMWIPLTGAPVCVGVFPCFPDRPSFAAIDLEQIPQLRGVETVDVWLQADTNDVRLWAFVSVTNNETQSVTLHSPQHKRPAK
jgi:hypothetical protein